MCKPSPVKLGQLVSGELSIRRSSAALTCVQRVLQLVQLHSPVRLYPQHGTGGWGALANTAISKQEDPSPEKDPSVLLEIRVS